MAEDSQLDVLLDYLKRTRGFDFTGYKRTTLGRRIAKRMDAVGVDSHAAYVDFLEVHPDEFAFLFNTILINVTGFFRDTAAWDYLTSDVVPRALEGNPEGPFRVWCAGCASGEETYSLAMVLAEALGEEQYLERVKIYGTDVDEEALTEARLASYSATAVEAVPTALRERYFERVEQRYAFRKRLRRAVIFGRNDLVQDAPISRIDLLTCRNTLMYFNAETQAQILGRFHFALNDWGYLYLGKSEMLITHSDLFKPVSVQRRVFTKVARPTLRDRLLFTVASNDGDVSGTPGSAAREGAFDAAPVAQIAVDAGDELILANENARALFGLSLNDVGRPLRDLEISYRPVDLRSNIELAHTDRRGIALSQIAMTTPRGDARELEVLITPLYSGDQMLGTTITYADVTPQRRLQKELEGSKHELETAYEELQSTVEELETTNEELRQRSLELDEVNAFLETILTSLGVAVIVLDNDLSVRVWNAGSTDLWGVRADEAEGHHLLGLDLGLPVERLKIPLRKIMRNGQDRVELVLEATNRRGRQIECKVVALPFGVDGNEAIGAILIMEEMPQPAAS